MAPESVGFKTYVDWSIFAKPSEHLWENCKSKNCKLKCRVCSIKADDFSPDEIPNCRISFNDFGVIPEEFTQQHHFFPTHNQIKYCFICRSPNINCSKSASCITETNERILESSADQKNKYLKCIWCQRIIHNSHFCIDTINTSTETSICDFGILSRQIIPPSWIIKNRQYSDSNALNMSKIHNVFQLQPPANIPKNFEPIIAFINVSSGSRTDGYSIYNILLKYLNPRQIFLLPQTNPIDVLKLYQNLPKMQIHVWGGDGSMSWLASSIDALDLNLKCILCPNPLGTGNDLCQELKWGAKMTSQNLKLLKHFSKCNSAETINLDMWSVKITPNTEDENFPVLKTQNYTNYLSIGADGQIAMDFHNNREKQKESSGNRLANLYSYFHYGMKYIASQTYKSLSKKIQIICDDEDITDQLAKNNVQILLLCNIGSYAGGINPWKNPSFSSQNGDDVSAVSSHSKWNAQKINDGIIEVVGLSINSGPSLVYGNGGIRLAQCKSVKIIILTPVHIQVDGEPYLIPSSTLSIDCISQIKVKKRLKNGSVTSDISQSSAEICTSLQNVSLDNSNIIQNSAVSLSPDNTTQQSLPITPQNDSSPLSISHKLRHIRSNSLSSPRLSQNIISENKDSKINEKNDALNSQIEIAKDLIEAINNRETDKILAIFNNSNNLNIHQGDKDGNTPLHHAAQNKDFFTISLLIINGANPYVKNNEKRTPMKILKSMKGTRSIVNYINTICP